LYGVVDEGLDVVDLGVHDHGAAVDVSVGSVGGEGDSLAEGLDAGDYFGEEEGEDGLVDEEAFDAAAVLARVLEAASHGPWDYGLAWCGV